MLVYGWILTVSFTGANPDPKTYDKYATKKECQDAFIALKAEKKKEGKTLIGDCKLILKEKDKK